MVSGRTKKETQIFVTIIRPSASKRIKKVLMKAIKPRLTFKNHHFMTELKIKQYVLDLPLKNKTTNLRKLLPTQI